MQGMRGRERVRAWEGPITMQGLREQWYLRAQATGNKNRLAFGPGVARGVGFSKHALYHVLHPTVGCMHIEIPG
eukprot:623574-Hanusia_phi.AAC.1